jgi:hypothetical protein
MDPNSTYLLKIRWLANQKKAQKLDGFVVTVNVYVLCV